MNIYIDEAGAFIPPTGNRRYSLVLALVIPAAKEVELFYHFLRLRDLWPQQAIEIKGSKLDEDQTAEVLQLLAEYQVIAEYYAIDMNQHPACVIDEFKERQACAVTANLTEMHSDAVVQATRDEADLIRRLSNPLFVQAYLTMELIVDMLDVAINYLAQRRPSELGQFAWMIDRKDQTITEMEQLWSTLILPFGETRSALKPFAKVDGFDYSHFEKYYIYEETAGEKWKKHLQWMRETLPSAKDEPTGPLHCIDLGRIWTEDRAFEDSQNSLGLQLADIVATTLCRALNGNLQRSGWAPISQLLIRKKTAPFIQLGKAVGQRPLLQPQAEVVWRTLSAQSQRMVL
jgi:hypothetical protein